MVIGDCLEIMNSDNCMGIDSTGVARLNTNRNFIGIEIDEKYFNTAKERILTVESKINNAN